MGRMDNRNDINHSAKLSPPKDAVQRQIEALSGRDLQLWSISLLVVVVLGTGFAALVAPNLVWHIGVVQAEGRYLPPLFFGLISLILLFNLYIASQRRELNATRKALIQELIHSERLEGFSLADPLTQLFSRRAVDQMLAKEAARANRLGSTVSVLMIHLNDFKSINARLGRQTGDKILVETAQLLRNTFRGSDLLFRYGDDEFLVLMPDTTEAQAERAVERLLIETERWNVESHLGCELGLSRGLASYVMGVQMSDVLRRASRVVFLNKHRLVPVV
jgi:diguanylate cyclase (GGDEF)-like protein